MIGIHRSTRGKQIIEHAKASGERGEFDEPPFVSPLPAHHGGFIISMIVYIIYLQLVQKLSYL